MDETVPENMAISTELISIICPCELTFGKLSFEQINVEKKLCEEIIVTDRGLSLLADYGKLLFMPNFRFELIKTLMQWKLLIPEKLRSVTEEYIELVNNLFKDFSVSNQNLFIDFMRKLVFLRILHFRH